MSRGPYEVIGLHRLPGHALVELIRMIEAADERQEPLYPKLSRDIRFWCAEREVVDGGNSPPRFYAECSDCDGYVGVRLLWSDGAWVEVD